MAYTYHIFCRPTQQHYYGVKFAKNCDPNDLGIHYTSSSKKVKALIDKHGIENFIFTIRKIFDDPKAAVDWEQKVLRRLDVLHRSDWLNNAIGTSYRSVGPKSEDHKRKISLSHIGRSGRKHRDSTKSKMKATRQDLVWLSKLDTQETKLVRKHQVQSLLDEGWVEGRKFFKTLTGHSEKTRRQMSLDRKGKPNPKNSVRRRGMVSAVKLDGTIVVIPQDGFRADPSLVGINSREGKVRRNYQPPPPPVSELDELPESNEEELPLS